MRLPPYLRQKKKGMCFFEPSSKKRKDNLIHGFSIEFLNDEGVKVHRDIMMFTNPRANEEHMGVRGELLRRGKPLYLDDGLEVLNAIHNAVTGDTFYGYTVLFPLGSRHIYATFFGQGELSTFDESCKQIVSSVGLVKAGEAPLPARRWKGVPSGLGDAGTKRLKQALDGLPAELAYLRKAILAIAKQDQDLLGSGEADIGPIERSLRKVAKGGAIGQTAMAHADALHQWLIALPDSEGAWATPLGFVEGYLRGSAQFGADAL